MNAPYNPEPKNNSIHVPIDPVLNWDPSQKYINYFDQQVAARSCPKVAQFNVVLSDSTSFDSTVFSHSSHETQAQVIPDLNSFTTYYWKVKESVDPYNYYETLNDVWSDTWSFTTAMVVPVPLLPEDNDLVVPLYPTFSWMEFPGAVSYGLQISEFQDFSVPVLDIEDIEDLSYTSLIKLLTCRRYYWRINARVCQGGCGCGCATTSYCGCGECYITGWSEVRTFRTVPPPSEAYVNEGFLHMLHNGKDPIKVISNFLLEAPFEVSAELRQAYNPLYFSINNSDNTALIKFNGGDYTTTLYTGDMTYNCWGHLSDAFGPAHYTDHVCLTTQDIQNKHLTLTYLIDDSTDVAVNVVGGASQLLDKDFRVESRIIKWDGMRLDGQLKHGDILRVIYHAQGLFGPARIKFVEKDGKLTVLGKTGSQYERLMKRVLLSDASASPWVVSFYMDAYNPCYSGRGYISKFMAVSPLFDGTCNDLFYGPRTWRQPVILG